MTSRLNAAEKSWASIRRRQSGEIRQRNQSVEANLDLARKIAHRMTRQCTEPYEDLEQLAVLGLIKAVEKFDPSEGAAFSSFAVPFIQGEILHFLRDQWGVAPKVPRRAIEEFSKVRRVQRNLAKRGREVTDATEVAEGLGIPAKRWRWVAEARARKPMVPLDDVLVPISQPEESEDTEREWLYQKLEQLPDLQRNCLVERFFAGLEIEEIASRQQISSQTCQVLINQALDLLKRSAEVEHG